MTDRELMQQALDALEKLNEDGWILADFEDEVYASIEALRARLAQPEPEADVCCQDFEKCVRSCTPRGQWIAHVRCGCGDQIMPDDGAECGNCVTARNAVKQEPICVAFIRTLVGIDKDGIETWKDEPIYATPIKREWQGLTDEEVIKLGKLDKDSDYFGLWYDFARAIEAKLKAKNEY